MKFDEESDPLAYNASIVGLVAYLIGNATVVGVCFYNNTSLGIASVGVTAMLWGLVARSTHQQKRLRQTIKESL
jgi:hypothetical protein